MIRIAISQAAFDAIARTLPFGGRCRSKVASFKAAERIEGAEPCRQLTSPPPSLPR
jgi:hypothetical protein